VEEFVVNNLITLRLEDGKTNIYINNRKFKQCKRILINIYTTQKHLYSSIKSIDEVAETVKNPFISPKEEFWGHCSNLQTWFENDYNTNILHSNLSFPLLERLYLLNDKKAKKVFKEEIIERYKAGYINISLFVLKENYDKYFEKEEKSFFLLENNELLSKNLENGEKLSKEKLEILIYLINKFKDSKAYRIYKSKLINEIRLKKPLLEFYTNQDFHLLFEPLNEILEDKNNLVDFFLRFETKGRLFDYLNVDQKDYIRNELMDKISEGDLETISICLDENLFQLCGIPLDVMNLKNNDNLRKIIKISLFKDYQEGEPFDRAFTVLGFINKLFEDNIAKEMLKDAKLRLLWEQDRENPFIMKYGFLSYIIETFGVNELLYLINNAESPLNTRVSNYLKKKNTLMEDLVNNNEKNLIYLRQLIDLILSQ